MQFDIIIILQKTPDDNDNGTQSTGKGIYIWDHVTQKPVYKSALDAVRFGGVSVKVTNRYMPQCKGTIILYAYHNSTAYYQRCIVLLKC